MILKGWNYLPENMKNESVWKYYDILCKKRFDLFVKRSFDIVAACLLLLLLLPLFILIGIAIKIDSKGSILFRQVRVTQYGKTFRIYKFRTMVTNAESLGTQVTTKYDIRVTKCGKFLRKLRLDEIPQLLNILSGDMTFVGSRPEVVTYVEKYTDEMMATLLLPAGVTSEASIQYKDEERLLADAVNVERFYIEVVLNQKMKLNLNSIENFSFINDLKTMFRTIGAVMKRDSGYEAVAEMGTTNELIDGKSEVNV